MILPVLNPALFQMDRDHLWVLHCAEGPVPRVSVDAIRAFLPRELQPWELRFQEDFLGIPAQAREEAAGLLGVPLPDISLTQTTSTGLTTLAQGWGWKEGDEVLAPLGEFPSNIWPWKALAFRGVSFREAPLWEGQAAGARAWDSKPPEAGHDPEGRLLEALGPRTRFLTLSWVRFQDGLKLDLGRLGAGCRERGVHLVVDGIQGAGTAVPDLDHASAFVTGGHKGLLVPQGQGFLWTSPAFRAEQAPCGTWLSVEDSTDFRRASTDHDRAWLRDGRRFEGGGPPVLACTALVESLRLLRTVGAPAIAAHVARLQALFLEGLAAVPAWASEARRLRDLLDRDRLGSILALHHGTRGPQGLDVLLQDGLERGIYASVREGYLRIALHAWHGSDDVARLVAWLS